MPKNTNAADVLIVGGGSAGAVLAARLSQDPSRQVTLLEAGTAYSLDAIPDGLLNADVVADPAHDWGYVSRGNAQNPKIPTPRGKALGGSSSVNAGVAIRARRSDLDAWADYGVDGWSYDEVLPTFKAMENNPSGDDAYHGRSGPLSVRQRSDEDLTPGLLAFVDAAVAHGFKRISDFNGADQDGAGGYPMTVVNGQRQSTAIAYLTAQVRNRPNLTILGEVNVDRVLFNGDRAVGVLAADGATYNAGEVVLSGGSYGSPAILLRSGVGPATDLQALGIDVVANLPVGQRLHDQPFFYNAYALSTDHLQMTPAVGSLLWTASSEALGDELDLHITSTHLMPGEYSPTGGAIVLAISVVRPDSRGTLRLASTDPNAPPVIDDNYLGTDRDVRRMVEGVRISREIGRLEPFASVTAGEILPGSGVADDDLTDVVIGNLQVYGHPTSTVPMGGPKVPWAVVDAVGAVKGLTGLRVVDASIMPAIPSTVTNLTTIMIAERVFQRAYSG